MSNSEPKQWIVATKEARTLPVVDLLTGRGFITGKSGSGKSVLGGTTVYTEHGRKPIEEVERGERVLSLNRRTFRQEFREVNARLEHEADDLLRIALEDGTEIVGTEDHSFLTVQDLEIVPVPGSEVREGTWMPLSRELPDVETVKQVDLADYVTPANNVRVFGDEIKIGSAVDDRYFDLTFESGKVLGLYLAEGSLDSSHTVQISNVDDDVKAFLEEAGFKAYEGTSNRAFRPFGEFLREEFTTGSARKRIPSWVFNAPAPFKAGLISGFFDGDRTVIDHDVTVISKSPDLLRGIKELLRHFGISSTIREKTVMYGDETRRFERLTVDSFCLDRLAEVVELSDEKKAEKLTSISRAIADGGGHNSKDLVPNFGDLLNRAPRGRGWTQRASGGRGAAASIHNLTRTQHIGRETFNRIIDELDLPGRIERFGSSDIQWKRVAEVERLEVTRTVYDLDVAGNDNFIANGVFVHNSNSASVIAEELLENNYNLLVVDTDGEYFGLKERFELLHVGRGPECDVEVGPEHAEKLASIALDQNVPIILDVSDYLDGDEAETLIENVVEQLFVLEGDRRKPFLLVVEEMQEYLPQTGGKDDLADLLLRVAKRGRKRGLGLCGISQRPSAVDKDFITQADWMVWHRLTWPNDVDVVRDILGESVADEIADLADGEGYLVTDWDESVERVQFRQKKTFDAGATPGLEEYDRPDLKAVGPDLIRELTGEADEYRSLESVRPEAADNAAADDRPVPGDLEIDLEELLGGHDEGERPVESIDDPDELRELLEVERKRNQILEDEVRELKSIIRETEKRTRLEAVRSGPDDGDDDTLFEEPRREGTGGMLVEASLLLSYLLFGTVRRLRRLTGRLTPGRGSTGDTYPITTRRDEPAARLRRVVITLVVLATGLSVALLVWLW